MADRGSAIYAAYDARSREEAMDYETEHSASGMDTLKKVPKATKYLAIEKKPKVLIACFYIFLQSVLTTEAIQGAKKFTAGWGRLVNILFVLQTPSNSQEWKVQCE